ncbi:MAG: YitT family protein, partial [Cyanobacteria bacterium]|nr:YitT family protein [Cyanobacteriota bacterium]
MIAFPTYFKSLRNFLCVCLGILLSGMGIKGFLLASRFIDGGVTGVSMLVSDISGIPLAWLIPLINIPFILMGYYQIGLKFALKSSFAIVGLALCLAFIDFPHVTTDKLLTAVFGGFFMGAGIGMAMRGVAVLDGTEIAALLISKVVHYLRVGDVILIFNIFIFMAAAFYLGVEPAMYSILTYFTASKTVNFILHGIEEYTAIVIVSPHHAAIKEKILHELKRGVTIYKGAGGVQAHEQDILYCV